MNLFKQIYYIGGTIYRGMIGILHNLFDNPELDKNLTAFEIGKTELGRKILCYKFSGRQSNQERLLIVGGIHGNEVGTVKLAVRIANWLNLNQHKIGWSEIFIIPCLNLDGYAQAKKRPDYIHRGKVGRFNAHQVDLNRNFPAKNWRKEATDWRENKVNAGEYASSEQETQVLMQFIKREDIKNLIMLHNVGLKIFIDPDSKSEVEKKWAEIIQKETDFKIQADPCESGSAGPWAREQNINCITIEGSSKWGSDWKRQQLAWEEILKNI